MSEHIPNLKTLAESCIAAGEYLPSEARTESRSYSPAEVAWLEFAAQATPAAILALLKDLESHKRMLLDACVSIGSIGEALGLDMDADADMMIGTARDLIDGLNRIIQECPLGSPGFAIATEVMGELGVQQEDES
jgi:hypothetical protein